uniref:Uncharacterized protein n=1 Tax=Chromera velia CCMP2878 TaxID=1169474 RepID=A0A0G4G8N7_9ALVE|eukprot:Cvel_4335.t1-p1 / transcript=Cvel_4335.t1 / gene=Cvel_4335 / organism=Chromera_velia_CCMP2878 / gene_product=hypothetical protein / transcript_product=hypothetical protein / location=Cvel_scaffold188:19851-25258(+) / protein_length=612 / sequence_SO=supercontig / SO=protein_coding / is_pseudo=false
MQWPVQPTASAQVPGQEVQYHQYVQSLGQNGFQYAYPATQAYYYPQHAALHSMGGSQGDRDGTAIVPQKAPGTKRNTQVSFSSDNVKDGGKLKDLVTKRAVEMYKKLETPPKGSRTKPWIRTAYILPDVITRKDQNPHLPAADDRSKSFDYDLRVIGFPETFRCFYYPPTRKCAFRGAILPWRYAMEVPETCEVKMEIRQTVNLLRSAQSKFDKVAQTYEMHHEEYDALVEAGEVKSLFGYATLKLMERKRQDGLFVVNIEFENTIVGYLQLVVHEDDLPARAIPSGWPVKDSLVMNMFVEAYSATGNTKLPPRRPPPDRLPQMGPQQMQQMMQQQDAARPPGGRPTVRFGGVQVQEMGPTAAAPNNGAPQPGGDRGPGEPGGDGAGAESESTAQPQHMGSFMVNALNGLGLSGLFPDTWRNDNGGTDANAEGGPQGGAAAGQVPGENFRRQATGRPPGPRRLDTEATESEIAYELGQSQAESVNSEPPQAGGNGNANNGAAAPPEQPEGGEGFLTSALRNLGVSTLWGQTSSAQDQTAQGPPPTSWTAEGGGPRVSLPPGAAAPQAARPPGGAQGAAPGAGAFADGGQQQQGAVRRGIFDFVPSVPPGGQG